ncbi:MAG: NADP-dependent oxidoreductase [Chlamydiae bacterium]|nr:NADP-dependent oxidoreductase [Chlamydiota bacterium]
MKAILIHRFGNIDELKLEEIPIPTPKKNEVRIRIKAVAFNHVDCKMRQGVFSGLKLPAVLGVECSGIVDAVGMAFHDFSVGDEVLALVFGQGTNGTYAEYTCVPAQFVVKKPKNIGFEEAATVSLVGLTAFRALIASGALQEGKPLFIAGGGGGVGSFAIQLARIYRAGPIFSTAGNEESERHLIENLQISKKHILRYSGLTLEQMAERLIQMNGGNLFPAAFDFVGKEMKKLCFAIADYQGHIATLLPEEKGFPIELWYRKESAAFDKNLSVHFVFVGAESFSNQEKNWQVYKQHLSHLTRLIERNELHLSRPEVVERFSLEEVKKAHQKLESGKVKGKLAMKIIDSKR